MFLKELLSTLLPQPLIFSSVTRWAARHEANKTLATYHKEVMSVLTEINEDRKEKSNTRLEAKGVLNHLNNLESCFLSVVWKDILERFNSVSSILQSTKTELCDIVDLYESLIEFLSSMLFDFDKYEAKAIELFGNNVYKRDKNRPRVPTTFHDDGKSEDVRPLRSGSDDIRIEFFNDILASLRLELQRRCEAYKFLNDLFGFLTKIHLIASEDIAKKVRKLVAQYPNDLENSLEIECKHLAAYLKIKNIGKISAHKICRLLHDNNLIDIYPNYYTALCIHLSLMITNCSGERSFNALKRIKDRLRSTQTEDRLNALSILYIERDLTILLDPQQIIDKFSAVKARKVYL